LALEAVRRIDALFEIERAINGHSAEQRRSARQELSAPLVADLERWLREQRPKLSRGNDLAKAMDYILKRWPAFTRFLDDGRICLSEQRGRSGLARYCARQKVMVVRRFRPRWTARRGDVQADRHCQIEQLRPAGLVGRRPGPDRRSSRPRYLPATAVEL